MENAWTFDFQPSLGASMATYESKVAAGLGRGQQIIYEVLPHYIGNSVVPDYLYMTALCVENCTDDTVEFDVQIPNLLTYYGGVPTRPMAINLGNLNIMH